MAKTDKTAAEIEAERRAALTPEQRLEEDSKTATIAAQEAAAEEAAQRNPNARAALDSQRRGVFPPDNAPKDTEVQVARGREVFTEPNQVVGHKWPAKLMVSADEANRLRAAGHIVTGDDLVAEALAGPSVLRESGLIQGHSPGQGQSDKK